MVLSTILGLSISLVPCLMFGVIIMISFLLCNCEYIGETVAKHFCAWKNRRRDRLKSHSTESNVPGRRKSRQGTLALKHPSSAEVIQRNTLNLSAVNFETHFVETASAPTFQGDASRIDSNDDVLPMSESDPPPSYEECVKSQTPEASKHHSK